MEFLYRLKAQLEHLAPAAQPDFGALQGAIAAAVGPAEPLQHLVNLIPSVGWLVPYLQFSTGTQAW